MSSLQQQGVFLSMTQIFSPPVVMHSRFLCITLCLSVLLDRNSLDFGGTYRCVSKMNQLLLSETPPLLFEVALNGMTDSSPRETLSETSSGTQVDVLHTSVNSFGKKLFYLLGDI